MFYLKDISLYRHYYFKHKNNLERLNFNDTYEIAFLEQPSFMSLDYREHFWMSILKSNTNIAKTQYRAMVQIGHNSKSTFCKMMHFL